MCGNIKGPFPTKPRNGAPREACVRKASGVRVCAGGGRSVRTLNGRIVAHASAGAAAVRGMGDEDAFFNSAPVKKILTNDGSQIPLRRGEGGTVVTRNVVDRWAAGVVGAVEEEEPLRCAVEAPVDFPDESPDSPIKRHYQPTPIARARHTCVGPRPRTGHVGPHFPTAEEEEVPDELPHTPMKCGRKRGRYQD